MRYDVLHFHRQVRLEVRNILIIKQGAEDDSVHDGREYPKHLVSVPDMGKVPLVLEELKVDAQAPEDRVENVDEGQGVKLVACLGKVPVSHHQG